MPLPQECPYTINDVYNLPDGQRAELLNGIMYMMAPPNRNHQKISMFLSYVIKDYIISKNGDCDVYAAPFAVFLDNTDYTYVEPDISIICDKNKLDDKGCHGAPDWIIEIVSKSSRKMDCYTKLAAYKEADVRLYWIVDNDKKNVVAYDLEHEAIPAIYSFSDSIPVVIYPDLSIDFSLYQ